MHKNKTTTEKRQQQQHNIKLKVQLRINNNNHKRKKNFVSQKLAQVLHTKKKLNRLYGNFDSMARGLSTF